MTARDLTGTEELQRALEEARAHGRQLEDRLRDHERYSRSLLESSVHALMTVDPSGVIRDVNEQAVVLTGHPRHELIGRPFVDLFTDQSSAEAGVRQIFETGVIRNYELAMHGPTGRTLPVSFNASVFRTASGAVGGILAAGREITRQKQIEHDLREERSYTRGLIESTLDAVMTIDPQGIITDVNDLMTALTGRARDALVGTPFTRCFIDPQRAADGIRAVLADDRVSNLELPMTSARGADIVVSCSAATFRSADGQLKGVIAAARDITAQKALEAQLRHRNDELAVQNRRVQEANRLEREFLANVSHELRTPLNAIIGFSELLYDGRVGPLSATQHEYLGDVLTSAQHLLQLINDVLDLSKIESGNLEFRVEPVDLGDVIGEVRTNLRRFAESKRIEIGVEVAPDVTRIISDAAKLRQVLYNYLSNALKFTPDGGRVVVRARSEFEGWLHIEVEDSGIGIEPADLGRLFTPFQQLHASMATKQTGTGLGLAVTRRLVEAQGGRVGVRSTPGIGSVFFAVLPRALDRLDSSGNGRRPDDVSATPHEGSAHVG